MGPEELEKMGLEELKKLGLTEEHLKDAKEAAGYLKRAYKLYEDSYKDFDQPIPDYDSFMAGFIIGTNYMFKKCGGEEIIVATENGKIIGSTLKK